MKRPFIGRTRELHELSELLEKKTASLVVIQGRRRIGKSRLVEEFAKNHRFLHFSGTPPVTTTTLQVQLDEFATQLSSQTGFPEQFADNWSKLFIFLNREIQTGRVIVLFDEISWMGSKDPEFLGKLKNAWDIYFSKNPELILILCGSVSVWIDKNILSSTGFVGRISYRLTLEELTLEECNQFWPKAAGIIAAYEKLKVLSVTGGVPWYLEAMNPSLSAEQTIRKLCFTKRGLLVNEFTHIFNDIFLRRSDTYKSIIETLADGDRELKEIIKDLGVARSGFVSEYLEDLIKSGFVTRDYTWHLESGEVSRLSHFRLSDNFVRFYLKYIEKNLPKIENDDFTKKSLSSLPGWDTIMGLQFENLVLKNRRYIKKCLAISPDEVISDNPFFQRKTEKFPGCQIDYLIQTTFKGLWLCEFKFSKGRIGMRVIKEVQRKIDNLIVPKGFSIRPVLVQVNGVQKSVEDAGFFAKIINFGDLLSS